MLIQRLKKPMATNFDALDQFDDSASSGKRGLRGDQHGPQRTDTSAFKGAGYSQGQRARVLYCVRAQSLRLFPSCIALSTHNMIRR